MVEGVGRGERVEVERKWKLKTTERGETKDVRGSLRQIIQEMYDGKKKVVSDFDSNPQGIQMEIAKLVGQENVRREGRKARKFADTVNMFLEELIEFVKNKSKIKEEKKKLQQFIEQIDEILFGFSPNIANEAGLENLINLGALSTRVPEAQAWFGGKMTGETVYELAFCEEKIVGETVERLKGKTIAEKLDFINYLTTLGAHSSANDSSAYRAYDKINRIIRGLAEIETRPLVQYAIQLSEERLSREEENPSVSVVHFRGDRSGGRLHADQTVAVVEESVALLGKIQPDVVLEQGDKILRISKDAVAIFDHSNNGRFYSYYEGSELDEKDRERGLLAVATGSANEFLERATKTALNPLELERVVAYAQSRIIPSVSAQKGVNPEDVWSKIYGVANKEEWGEYFKNKKIIENARQQAVEYRADLVQKVESGEMENASAEKKFGDFLDDQERKSGQIYGSVKNFLQKLYQDKSFADALAEFVKKIYEE
ncbi:MAG: hypothetical protein ABII98_00800, partial [bacterium]